MDKRSYDKQYQRRMTRVVQVRLHLDKDEDILRLLDECKRDGVSYAQTVKHYIRHGICFVELAQKCSGT